MSFYLLTCCTSANQGVPRVASNSDNLVELTSLGNGQYSAPLHLDERGVFGASVFLEDGGSRCDFIGGELSDFLRFTHLTVA